VRAPGRSPIRAGRLLKRPDQWYQAILQQDALITQWERTLREGLEAVGEDSQAAARLRETWEFLQLMREEIPVLLEKWQARLAALRAQDQRRARPPAARRRSGPSAPMPAGSQVFHL
jgi:small-conductance mechanosensitive channel